MLEKSSQVILSGEDIKQYNEGIVSDNIKENWGFTLDQLSQVVNNKEYKLIENIK